MSSNRPLFPISAANSKGLPALAFVAFVAVTLLAGVTDAAEIDPGFGAGHGYVPIAASEPQSDIVASVVRQDDDRIVVLGRRFVLNRGVLFLQRYSPDGTFDENFGDKGTVTIDGAGQSLAPRELLLQASGRLIVVAETASTLRMFAFLPNGQPDPSFGIAGEQQVALNAGVPAGSASIHPVVAGPQMGRVLVIMPNTPGTTLGLTLYRYTIDGKVDEDFGSKGKNVLTNLGAGLVFAGVSAGLPDGRFIVAASATAAGDPTRTLFAINRDGILDVGFGNGGMASPAVLQGKDVRLIAPLSNNYFVVAASIGTGPALLSTLHRFDPVGRLDTQFASAGTARVEPAGGGAVTISDVFEQLDNNLVVTGSTVNGLFTARYLQRGIIDPTFNAGRGPVIIQEPSSAVTRGVASVNFDGSQLIHFGNGIAFGASPSSLTAPSRAFFISTTDGLIDANYAGKGIISLFGRKAAFGEFAQQILPLPDGRVAVLSATGADNGLLGTLSRFFADGTVDATFGVNGRSTFPLNGKCEWPLSMALQPDSRIVVLGTSFNTLDCNQSAMFGKRFDVNGQQENFAIFYGGSNALARSGAIAVQSDGKSVVTGQDDRALVVARFMQGGLADPTFGDNGRSLWVRSANDIAKGGAILIQPDQKIVVAGAMSGSHLVLLRYLPSGALDPAFAAAGVSLTEVTSSGFLEVQALKQTPSGRFLLLARLGQRPLLAQFGVNGAIDTSFGNGGLLQLPLFVGGSQYSRFGLALQSDGGIVVSGQSTDTPASLMALIRLSATGQPDAGFAPNGILLYRPSVYFAAGATAIAALDGANLLAAGYGLPGGLLVRVHNAIVAGTAIEFYNTILNHYFITADPAEQVAVDAGAAGPGWTRTSMGFRVYTNALGVPVASIPVCRFYGTNTINPATGQRRGPNSHFYTAVAAECAAVKNDPGWTFESIAFFTQLPEAPGSCATGTIAVYRVYNNRAQFNDSNHRYTTDLATYQLMQSMGWKAEGVVFCSALG